MDDSTKFWNRIAPRYSRQPIADVASYRRKLEITQSYFHPQMSVLELGCGTGSTAIIHAPEVKQIKAVDIASAMIDIARAKAERAGIHNIQFEVASIEQLVVADQSVDMVLAMSVLHLVDDFDAAIRKMTAMLKPGGLLVTSTACLADDMNWLRLILPVGRAVGMLPKVSFFTQQQLLASFENNGFIIEERWKPGKRKAVFMVARKPLPQLR